MFRIAKMILLFIVSLSPISIYFWLFYQASLCQEGTGSKSISLSSYLNRSILFLLTSHLNSQRWSNYPKKVREPFVCCSLRCTICCLQSVCSVKLKQKSTGILKKYFTKSMHQSNKDSTTLKTIELLVWYRNSIIYVLNWGPSV